LPKPSTLEIHRASLPEISFVFIQSKLKLQAVIGYFSNTNTGETKRRRQTFAAAIRRTFCAAAENKTFWRFSRSLLNK